MEKYSKIMTVIVLSFILELVSIGVLVFSIFTGNELIMNVDFVVMGIASLLTIILLSLYLSKYSMSQTWLIEKVFIALILFLFLSTFVGVFWALLTGNLIFIVFFMGQFIALGGVLGLSVKEAKQYSMIFIPIGVFGILFSIVYLYGAEGVRVILDNFIYPLGLGIVFMVFGIGIWYDHEYYRYKMLKKCTLEVEGFCVALEKPTSGRRGGRRGIFEYFINGEKYIFKDRFFEHIGIPKINEIKIINVNPNNYNESYRKLPFLSRLSDFVLWGGCLGGAVYCVVFALKYILL